MADDMRMSPGVADHRKIERLCRALGDGAFRCLVRLWGYAAQERRDGRLTGMTDEDIEAEARWSGEPGLFVRTLTAVRLLDIQAGGSGGRTVSLHNWPSRQAFIMSFAERSAKAAENARVGWERRKQAGSESGNADSMPPACDPHQSAERPARAAHAPSLPPTNLPTNQGGHREGGGYGGRKGPHPSAPAVEDAGSIPGPTATPPPHVDLEVVAGNREEQSTDPQPGSRESLTALLAGVQNAPPEKTYPRRWQRNAGLTRIGEDVPTLSPADEEASRARLQRQKAEILIMALAEKPPPPPAEDADFTAPPAETAEGST